MNHARSSRTSTKMFSMATSGSFKLSTGTMNWCSTSMPRASTANFNEVLAFIAKDAVLVIDDFRPNAAERRRLEGEADRLLRAAANGAGRGRLKSDTSLRPGPSATRADPGDRGREDL